MNGIVSGQVVKAILLARREDGDHPAEVCELTPDKRLKVDVSATSSIPTSLVRASETLTVSIRNGQALSDEIDTYVYSMIGVHMPAAWTAARLAIQASPTLGGTYQPIYDELGNLIRCNGGANVVASTSYTVPPSAGWCRYIRLWSENGAGGDINQGGNRAIMVDLKA